MATATNAAPRRYYGAAWRGRRRLGDDRDRVVVVASDAEMLLDEVYVWWQFTVPALGLN